MIKAATKPKVSSEEKEYRNSKFSDYEDIVNKKNLLCTSCNVSVRPFVLRGKVKSHPFLDTLLCDKCYSFYGDGNFSVDEEDGSDKYCRWCGQGGTLYLCSTCTGGFCKKCIKRNLPRSELKSVESDDWSCFCCDVKPLFELRALCWAASTYVKEKSSHEDSDKKKRKRKASVSSESENEDEKKKDSDASDSETEKKSPKKKPTKSSKSTPDKRMEMKKIRVLLTKMNSVAQDAIKMCDLSKGKLTELKSKKLTTRFVKDEDTALSVSTKLVNSLSSIENLTAKFRTIIEDYVKQWSALSMKQEETNGDVNDKKDEEEDEEEDKHEKKEDTKDDSDDLSSSTKKKAAKTEEEKQTTETASKRSDDEDGNKSDADEKTKESDSDDQSTKKKKSLRRTPSTDSKDGKRKKSTKDKDAEGTSAKSLKRKHSRNSSSVDSTVDETPKRKRSKKLSKVEDSDDDAASNKEADETKSDDSKPASEHSDNDD